MYDPAKRYFRCTDSERAAFEAGIKLGRIFHQYQDTPISVDNVLALEKAIAEGAKIQPFVTNVKVRINRKGLRRKMGSYGYMTLTGTRLDVWLRVQYMDVNATCRIKYIKKLHYPLMYIESIEKIQQRK